MSTKIENGDAEFNLQLKTFVSKIPTYQTLFGLTTAQINSNKADSLAFDYTLNCLNIIQTFAHNYTKYKTELRHDNITNLGGFPVLPVLAAAPAPVAADIEARFRALIQIIVHHAAYTDAIGKDLGIVAPASTFDPATGKPVFTIELAAGGHPKLYYTKGDFDGVEIWKDSGAGFVMLQRATLPNYTDTSALPAAGVAVVWNYKMIFVYKDAVVGSYSDSVSVTVNGHTGPTPTTGTTTGTTTTPPAAG
jgi:hypothetical protein